MIIDDLDHQEMMFTFQTSRAWFSWHEHESDKKDMHSYTGGDVSAMNISLEITKRACGKTQRTRELSEHNRNLHTKMKLKEIEPSHLRRK